ncbi:zinc dependent phospholipase C family protein [Oceanobacillus salinisoli]|uniref:zinc dependent phospholipase C family protein n=1 Tax=Oceanobacillus salinisoli TaxID=2678611 RepID=UPI0012E2625A|nr:zinc dependent phospholipase C family protein [Oceanobacillus salinisoli]
MPNIWTHILFCEEVVDAVNQPFLTSQTESFLKLGAQGPDPLFYYNFWPWIKDEPFQQMGMALHTRQCGPFLMELITSAKKKSKCVRAFVVGFLTHHILDRNTHPYIHYHAGYEGSNHQKLEVIIDTLMMKKYHHLKTWKTQVYKEIHVGSSLNQEIIEMMHTAINNYYPEFKNSSPSYIHKAYKDMILALKLLSDPHGWKNLLFRSYISSYSHQPVQDDKDYLNLQNQTWYHSATNEPSNKSFIDLYEEGRVEAIEILTELGNYWKKDNEGSRQKLEKLIGNISYDTGKPVSLGLENKFSNPLFH